MGDIRYVVGGADEAERWEDQICALYDDVFSRPPFHWRADESALHRDRLLLLATEPSFGIALALAGTGAGTDLAGFAYGYGLGPGTHWWAGRTGPLPDDLIAEWPGRTFLLFDFAVHADHRGHGVGRRLHDTLLGSRTEQRATLAVQPAAVEVKKVYERWHWHRVGAVRGGETAAAPLFEIYLRDSIADLGPASVGR